MTNADADIGHNSAVLAADQLKAFLERIERLEEEKKTISDDIKDVYGELKGVGYDVKAMRTHRTYAEDGRQRPGRAGNDLGYIFACIGNDLMIIADVGFMQVDVFEGGNGDLVFCQEHPHIDGEHYSRIITNMDNAEAVCEAIMAAVRKARAK